MRDGSASLDSSKTHYFSANGEGQYLRVKCMSQKGNFPQGASTKAYALPVKEEKKRMKMTTVTMSSFIYFCQK